MSLPFMILLIILALLIGAVIAWLATKGSYVIQLQTAKAQLQFTEQGKEEVQNTKIYKITSKIIR